MFCKNPYMMGVIPGSCGQCMPCRINRRRLWVHRIILESYKHEKNCFLTLTYDDEHLPPGYTLVSDDTKLWLKRFRKAISPVALRYFLVGEYGDQSERPHYHAALFGVGVDSVDLIRTTWGKGHVMVGDLNPASARYIAGYVVKKLTKKDDPRLKGRYPEFARMSLKPGLGATAMRDVADSLMNKHGIKYIKENLDVPVSLKHANKSMPLGKYLRSKLREEVGFTDNAVEAVKRANQSRVAQEMLDVLEVESLNKKNEGKSIKRLLVDKYKGKVASIEARAKIYSQDRTTL